MGISTGFRTSRVDVNNNQWKRLSSDSTIIADTSIVLRCHPNNTGNIWVSNSADSEVQGALAEKSAFPLFPGDVLTLDIRRPYEVWVRGDTSINYLWWLTT